MIRRAPLVLMALACALPLLSLVGHPGAYLADPLSELPVKLYFHETFWARGYWLGGVVDTIGYPLTGPINNPDPVGMVVTGLLAPIVGRPWAYNLFIWLELFAAALSAWVLARGLCRDEVAAGPPGRGGAAGAAPPAGVAYALTPLLLVYPLAGAITDMLNVWPYPLAIHFALRALRRPGWRDGALAGAFAAAGLASCPYNFVVFSIAIIPSLLWLPVAWGQRLVPEPDPDELRGPAADQARQWGRAVLGLGLVFGALGGLYMWQLRSIMSDPTSQMSDAIVSATRHAPPYLPLNPRTFDHYVAHLADYVAVGKDALFVRVMGARQYRALSPGLFVIAVSLLGVMGASRRRAALLWPLIAAFAALASAGPFLALSTGWGYDEPVNPVWLGIHHYFPGGSMLLEPFRYGILAAMALSIAAAVGVAALARRLGRWVAWAAPAVVVVEVALLSPVPLPLPTYTPDVPPVYGDLDDLLPPGAIIELPYTDKNTPRFVRDHFVNQLTHGRPIANEVQGFFPRYLVENEFTAKLLSIENKNHRISIQYHDRGQLEADRRRLAADGFAGVILDPARFADPAEGRHAEQTLSALGEPVARDGRLIYRLDAP